MNVATYSRVSTSDKGQNPQVQVEELRRYCSARGWKVVHEIIDHGFKGATDDRPGLRELLRLVKGRHVDGVVVVKLDRLFRSLKHLVTTLDEWQLTGVIFCATADAVDYSTPAGRFFVQILGSLAEFEKSLLRERTMMGLAHARNVGKTLGRPRTTDDAAILKLRSKGLSYSQIEKELGVSRPSISRAIKGGTKTSKISDEKTESKQGKNRRVS